MKIVVCDDHSIFRAGLVAVLEDLPDDVELVESDSAAAALEAVESGSVSLVLLDLHMPGMDGWGALRALRSSHPSVAVVIVSASEDAADIRAALEAGASGFIPKSSSASVLLDALQLVIDGGVYIPPELLAPPSKRASTVARATPAEYKRRRRLPVAGRREAPRRSWIWG
jgi:DNA-binding NarL/FixJ family response regulator